MDDLKLSVLILNPTVPEPDKDTGVKQSDVWSDEGMRVAWGGVNRKDTCPIWGDELPYKSVTVVCEEAQENEVVYWLEYVHGGGSVSKRKELGQGKIALRSDYLAW